MPLSKNSPSIALGGQVGAPLKTKALCKGGDHWPLEASEQGEVATQSREAGSQEISLRSKTATTVLVTRFSQTSLPSAS
jgi:hypothetical protein